MPEPESFLDRIVRIFRQKAAARVRHADDPAEAIDVLIGEQLTTIANARADLTRVASAEKRLEMLVAEFDQRRAKYDDAIRATTPDDPRARTDARRSLECERNAAEGRAHGAEVTKQRIALAETIEDMRAQYDRLRMRREATNALATAARASVQSQESMTPLGANSVPAPRRSPNSATRAPSTPSAPASSTTANASRIRKSIASSKNFTVKGVAKTA